MMTNEKVGRQMIVDFVHEMHGVRQRNSEG